MADPTLKQLALAIVLFLALQMEAARGGVGLAAIALYYTNWSSSDGCSIRVISFFPDELEGSRALVRYSDASESYAVWTLSGAILTLGSFRDHSTDTFTGNLDGVLLRAVHTWNDKSGSHTETCDFTEFVS
jgi:hypothetical protein